jgi:hypothetical protein
VDADTVLFFALLFVAIAIAGATAFVIFWPLTLVHVRDRQPASPRNWAPAPSSSRPHWHGCCGAVIAACVTLR